MREQCPNCGADLAPNAQVCPECGSDETTGWSEHAADAELGLPDDSFDYDEFVKQEFGGPHPTRRGLHWFWWLVAVLILAGALWFSFR